MNNLINIYLNSISENNLNVIKEQLQLNCKLINEEYLSKGYRIRNFNNNIILEEATWSFDADDFLIQVNKDGLVKVNGGTQVEIQNGQQKQTGYVLDKTDELKQQLSYYKDQAKIADQQTAQNVEKGFGEEVWNKIKNGAAVVTNGVVWLLEAPGKLLSWPLKELSAALSSQTEKYTPPSNEQGKIRRLISKGKALTDAELTKLKNTNSEFYQVLMKAVPGTIMYQPTTKKIYAKNKDNKVVLISYTPSGWAYASQEQQHQAIDAAAKQVKQHGIDQGAVQITAQQAQQMMNNPQVRSAMNGLKLRDKKSQGGFLAMIMAFFNKLFGNTEEQFEEYTPQQLMDFTPYIKQLVKNGTLKPGKYQFEYKG